MEAALTLVLVDALGDLTNGLGSVVLLDQPDSLRRVTSKSHQVGEEIVDGSSLVVDRLDSPRLLLVGGPKAKGLVAADAVVELLPDVANGADPSAKTSRLLLVVSS